MEASIRGTNFENSAAQEGLGKGWLTKKQNLKVPLPLGVERKNIVPSKEGVNDKGGIAERYLVGVRWLIISKDVVNRLLLFSAPSRSSARTMSAFPASAAKKRAARPSNPIAFKQGGP